jgi:hypothetical protein
MSGGGGKGGSQTTKIELPEWYESAAKKALALGEAKAKAGYVPYMGPDVAAFSPQQVQGMQTANDFAAAFGMAPQTDIASTLPPAQEFAGGVRGYSSFPLYKQALAALDTEYPGLSGYLKQFFIDPTTGKLPTPNVWDPLEKKKDGDRSGSSTDREWDPYEYGSDAYFSRNRGLNR